LCLHTLIKQLFTAHSPSTLLRVVRGEKNAERAERKKQHPFGKFSLLEFIGVRIYNLGWQLLIRWKQIVFHLPLLASRLTGPLSGK
jgi:hypothetical protein